MSESLVERAKALLSIARDVAYDVSGNTSLKAKTYAEFIEAALPVLESYERCSSVIRKAEE